MPGTELVDLNEYLDTWPQLPSVPRDFSGPHLRLAHAALGAAADTPESGTRDLAVLARHVLRQESIRRGTTVRMLIPQDERWPDSEVLEACGIRGQRAADRLAIEALPWLPKWSPEVDPSAASFIGESRRRAHEVGADATVTSLTGYSTYVSAGHRESVRAGLLAPPGATLAVTLPTGGGKSSVFLAPVLAEDLDSLTLVVVPTVALALDLEQRVREIGRDTLPRRVAYYGGLREPDREAIRQQIRDGSQRLLIAAPESVLGSLRVSLQLAAEKGAIRRLVVDEAHLVAQWGDAFRPAYQHLAPLWRTWSNLIGQAAEFPVTILLSATHTDYSLDVLRSQFASSGPFWIVGQPTLRSEHQYWIQKVSPEGRDGDVLSALDHLPRPALLYTTERQHASRLFSELTARGFRRVALFTGSTDPRTRERVVEQWRADDLDLVVATSAFGLGVDKPDVRAVVHATVPESLDRFYQEVGRSGRDGRSTLSLTLWTEGDLRTGRGLATKKIVTWETAKKRWRSMYDFRSESQLEGNAISVPISATHPDLLGDSEKNQYWNLQVLQLMERAGFITLASEPTLPSISDDEEVDWEAWYSHVSAFLNRGDLAIDDPWQTDFEAVRRRIADSSRRGFEMMREALQASDCIGKSLARMYRITLNEGWVEPAITCGGCPYCRNSGRDPYEMTGSPVVEVTETSGLSTTMTEAIGSRRPQFVRIDPEVDQRYLARELPIRLLSHGFRHLLVPEQWLSELGQANPHKMAIIEATSQLHSKTPPHLWSPSCAIWTKTPAPDALMRVMSRTGVQLAVLPSDTPDPRHPGRLLCEIEPTIPVTQLLRL